jgi:hypothetical protein
MTIACAADETLTLVVDKPRAVRVDGVVSDWAIETPSAALNNSSAAETRRMFFIGRAKY